MDLGRTRLGDRWERFFDLVAAGTIIAAVVAAFTGHLSLDGTWATSALLFVGGAILPLRRRYPIATATAAILLSGLALLTPTAAVVVWVLAEICLFSVPLHRSRTAAVVVATIHALVLYMGALVAFEVAAWDPLALILPVWTLAVVAFGSALRSQDDYVTAVEHQAATAAAARANEVRRHIDAERLHIARDLHDSVANSITVVNLEASNAHRHVLDDPDRTLASLDIIRSVTRTTLMELAGILAILRDDTDGADRTVATATNIPQLVTRLQSPDRPIDADTAALDDLALSPAADSAMYRVVQEALTNAHRHGRGPTRLTARIEQDHVVLEIVNRVEAPSPGSEPGFGLIGMRERVESAGGTVIVSSEGETFSVEATVPHAMPRSEEKRS